MKEKILAQLKLKYAGVSVTLLGLYADKISAKVTADDQIEGEINELEKLPISIEEQNKFYQTEGDRRASEAASTREANLKEKFNLVSKADSPPTPPNPHEPPKPPKPSDELELLKKRLDTFERNEVRSKHVNRATNLLDEKKIPKSFYSKILGKTEFESNEQIESVVSEIESDFTTFKQSMIDEGMLSVKTPVFGSPNTTGVSPAMVKHIAEKGAEGQSNSLGSKKL